MYNYIYFFNNYFVIGQFCLHIFKADEIVTASKVANEFASFPLTCDDISINGFVMQWVYI